MKKLEIVKSFVEILGNVDDWECVGFAEGWSSCVCGHPIYNQYIIQNKITKRTEVVGSECIENFKNYSIELYNALKGAEKQHKNKIKKQKKDKKDEINKQILKNIVDEYNSLIPMIKKAFENLGGNYRRIDYDVWSANREHNVTDIDSILKNERYKTVKSWIKHFERELIYVKNYVKDFQEKGYYDIEPYEPPKWDGSLWFGKYKNYKIQDVKPDYLKWIYENFLPLNSSDEKRYREMKNWIKENIMEKEIEKSN